MSKKPRASGSFEPPAGWARDTASLETVIAAVQREQELLWVWIKGRTDITHPRIIAAALGAEAGTIIGTLHDPDNLAAPMEKLATVMRQHAEAAANAGAERRAAKQSGVH